MDIKPLYKIIRDDDGVTVTPDKPSDDIEYTEDGIRIIADKDKVLTKDNVNLYSVVDTDSVDGWFEIDKPAEIIDSVNDEEYENIEE